MTFAQLLPALALGALSLTTVPSSVTNTVDALLGVPAIAEVVPDEVEAWIGEALGTQSTKTKTSPSSTSTKTKGGGSSASVAPQTTAARTAPEANAKLKGDLSAPASREVDLTFGKAKEPLIAPKLDPVSGAKNPAPTVRPDFEAQPTKSPTPSAARAEKDAPFGQWVKEQTHSGVKGRELAEAIHAEKARRK
ncbi:MAG: hypothetical protein EP330_05320 [Deltaproteobacteria bacterium]|nr:MAG: hypothetical protein EP330_05320 [Deltaproteobacteria bacterium]